MIRWLGLWRLVVGRVRSDWPFLLALWLLIASATTLLAGGALYAETVEVGGLRRALAEAPPQQRGVSVRFSASPAELAEAEPELRSALESAFGRAGTEARLTLRSTSLRTIDDGATAESPERRLTMLGAYEGLEEHAQLTGGRWPAAGQQPVEAAVSDGTLAAFGLALGDRLSLADASVPGADPTAAVVEVVVVGSYSPDPDDPYWLGDPLELTGSEDSGRVLFRGPLMVAREDLASAALVQLDVRGRALPLLERMRVDMLDEVRAAIGGLPRRVEAALPSGRFVTVERELAAVLGRIDRSSLVSRSGVVLVTLQFAVLAGYAVLLVGGILAERRRPEVALLRARGGSSAEIGLIAAGEAFVLSAPAVAVAPLLGILLVNAVGSWGPVGESEIIRAAQLSPSTLLVALLAGLACLLALTLPALLAEIDLARVRAALGRPMSQTLAQRLGLDLVLLAIAVIGILQLRTYGAPLTETTGGSLELDPLLVAAPAIALAAGAVLVVRLVPRLGELAERLLRRRRGILLALATRQVARRPLRYTRSALLIVLAAALGTFGTMYGATWSQSQLDQAEHQAGADLRVVLGQRAADGEATAEALLGLPGVEAVSPVVRDFFDVGRALRRAQFVALEPETLGSVINGEAGRAAQIQAVLGTLEEARPPAAGIELPAGMRRLAIVLDAQLAVLNANPDFPVELEEWPGIGVSPLFGGGDAPNTLEPQPAFMAGGEQRLVFDLSALPGAEGQAASTLQGLLIDMSTPASLLGEVRLLAVEASQSTSGDADWQVVARPVELSDWTMEVLGDSVTAEGTETGGRLVWDRAHPLRPDFQRPAQYRWAPSSGTEIALTGWVNDALLRGSGVRVGDQLDIDYQFQQVPLLIAGRLPDFPSLDPAMPFAVVDAQTLNRLRFGLGLAPVQPDEWWLAAADESVEEIAAAALADPLRAETVVTQQDLTRTLLRDPIALGLVGALLLGSLAAAAFASIGLLVNAVVSAREQLGELALLRALGASRRHVLAWLTLEHGFVLAVGLLAGASVGYLIGQLVLPHAPLNRSGARVVPPPEIVVPLELLLLVGLAGAAVVALGVAVARREVARRPVVDVLRERED